MKLFDCLRLSAWMTLVSAFFVFSACNGTMDQDQADSIPRAIPVEKVIIEQGDCVMVVGESEQLTATVLPENASNKSVDWSSTNEDVVVISRSGKATALTEGEARIVATAGDETASITITVIFNPSVTVDAEFVSFGKERLKGQAFFTQSDKSVKYGFVYATTLALLSSDPSVVYADNIDSESNFSYIVDDLSPNTTYFWRSFISKDEKNYYGETKSFKTATPVSSITLSKTELVLNEGETEILTAEIAPEDVFDKTLTWASDHEEVAYVNQEGKVVAASKGQATITVSANDGSGTKATCSVTVIRPVTSITLDKTSLTIYNGKTETLTATVNPPTASYTDVNWSSSNTSVATVSSSGVVTGVARGTATITAAAKDGSGKSASCQVEVKQYVTDITLNYTSLWLEQGQTTTLTATVTPSNANDKSLTWSSSNTAVATVSSSGVVTGVAGGTTTITATAKDGSGKKVTCLVVVRTDLSSSKSANCYIVSSAGPYQFKTVKGNSSTSVGSVSKAEVLWESFGTSTAPSKGDIISNVSYSGNYIFFDTPSSLKNGNAVIAAKDASGNILWSWHIWVCSGYNPASTAQTYYNSAGTMMDRNLGATSAAPGNVGALGLLYQWGRKDPFLGGCQISYSSLLNQQKAASTLSWPSAVSSTSSNGTVAYAVENPTTFITEGSATHHDWVYSSRDNMLWQTSKTIYDPCPPGWKVPVVGSSGVWSKAVGSSSDFSYTWNSTNMGMNFSGKFGGASTIWYPAAGCLGSDDGSLYNVGSSGYWWPCLEYILSPYYDNVYPSNYVYRACGLSVRCLQE